jgi:hypothetical protein
MAEMPTGVARGVCQPPNETHKGDRRANGYLPLAGGAPTVHDPNAHLHNGDRGMSAPMTTEHGVVQRPDHTFNVNQVKMPQPASAVQPGHGAIPVNPFQVPGGPMGNAAVLRDSAKK